MVTKSPESTSTTRLQELAEVAPVHGVGRRRKIVIGWAGPAARRRSGPPPGRSRRRPTRRAPPRRRPPRNALLRKLRRSLSSSSSSFLRWSSKSGQFWSSPLHIGRSPLRYVRSSRNSEQPACQFRRQICVSDRRTRAFGAPKRISAFSAISANGFRPLNRSDSAKNCTGTLTISRHRTAEGNEHDADFPGRIGARGDLILT